MRRTLRCAVAGCLLFGLALTGSGQGTDVTLKKVKIEEVTDYLKTQKGKVVVVDVWNFLCQPCKIEFPNLVKLHKKYDGKVACVSVSAGLEPEKFSDKTLGFLKKQEAAFPNFFLGEDEEWDKAFKVESGGVPVIVVYDQKGTPVFEYKDGFYFRNGKKEKIKGEPHPYVEVNKVVAHLVGS